MPYGLVDARIERPGQDFESGLHIFRYGQDTGDFA